MFEKRIIFRGNSLGTETSLPSHNLASQNKIFLLSPANASGVRARTLLGNNSASELAQRLRETGATLGEIYKFLSTLYFRGKLEYAETFKNPPTGVPGIFVITPSAGLSLPGDLMNIENFRAISAGDIHPANNKYRLPLDRDLALLRERIHADTQIILLGSIATPKYLEPLLEVFKNQVVIPELFPGRGDMSRGSLLLRSAATASELRYIRADTSLYTK